MEDILTLCMAMNGLTTLNQHSVFHILNSGPWLIGTDGETNRKILRFANRSLDVFAWNRVEDTESTVLRFDLHYCSCAACREAYCAICTPPHYQIEIVLARVLHDIVIGLCRLWPVFSPATQLENETTTHAAFLFLCWPQSNWCRCFGVKVGLTCSPIDRPSSRLHFRWCKQQSIKISWCTMTVSSKYGRQEERRHWEPKRQGKTLELIPTNHDNYQP